MRRTIDLPGVIADMRCAAYPPVGDSGVRIGESAANL
jgi:hypothetical protein